MSAIAVIRVLIQINKAIEADRSTFCRKFGSAAPTVIREGSRVGLVIASQCLGFRAGCSIALLGVRWELLSRNVADAEARLMLEQGIEVSLQNSEVHIACGRFDDLAGYLGR